MQKNIQVINKEFKRKATIEYIKHPGGLELSKVGSKDEGLYECIAENTLGKFYTRPIRISIRGII